VSSIPVARARTLTIFSHNRTEDVARPLRRVLALASEFGAEVRLPAHEAVKHGIEPRDGVLVGVEPDGDTDLALVLGGDGTILATLRLFAGREVPVFAVNFGAIGFLATIEPGDLDDGIRRALAGEFDVMRLPALIAATPFGDEMAVNDVSFHRRHNGRVAEIAYSVESEELGMVRCDGLVVSTPAGSTGYNLANGGPVLAWGVEGYVVSFIAPHTLTARSLVVAPGDTLEVTNRSMEDALDMTTDGRACHPLAAGDTIPIRFEHSRALLAQAPGATFYHRLRDKFGRLAY
jgi:NAD+ kinase